MNRTPISILLLGTPKTKIDELARQLDKFRICHDANNPESLAAVVYLLSDSQNIPHLETLSRLPWIFVGALDSEGFHRLATSVSGLQSWRLLKEPLLEGELASTLGALLREKSQIDSEWRLRSHEALRSVLRPLGHEFANFFLRITSRGDLAQREQNREKLQHHLDKLVDASEGASALLKKVQEFSRQGFSPKPGSLSSVVGAAFVKQNFEKPQNEPPVAIDSASLKGAMENIAEFFSKKMPSGSIAARYALECEHGYPGIRVILTGTGEVSEEFSKDLALPLAERVIELHGGNLKTRSGPSALEVSIWLPISSC